MRMKYCSRVLALLLAASLMAGDCIPVMATEQQAEVTEESAGSEQEESEEPDTTTEESESGDTVENVTEETEEAQEADQSMDSGESSESATVMDEETKTENVGDESSENAGETENVTEAESQDEVIETVEEMTVEIAQQAANLSLDTSVTVEEETWAYFTFEPDVSGYYYFVCESDITSLVYTYGYGSAVYETPVVDENGDIINYYYLTGSQVYNIEIFVSADGKLTICRDADYEPTFLYDGDTVALNPGETKVYKVEEGLHYVGLTGENSTIVSQASVKAYEGGTWEADVFEQSEDTSYTVWNAMELSYSSFTAYTNFSEYLILYNGNEEATVTVTMTASPSFATQLTEWPETLELAAGATGYYEFTTTKAGDYYVKPQTGLKVSFAEGIYQINENDPETGNLAYFGARVRHYTSIYEDGEGREEVRIRFTLTNTGNTAMTVELVTQDYFEDCFITLTKDVEANINVNSADYPYHYLTYTAEEAGIYQLTIGSEGSIDWMTIDGEELYYPDYDCIPLEKGQTLLAACYLAPDSFSEEVLSVVLTEWTEVNKVEGNTLTVEGGSWDGEYYVFTPSESGTYAFDMEEGSVSLKYFDLSVGVWRSKSGWFDDEEELTMTLEEGRSYFFRMTAYWGATLVRSKKVTVLDYDYYNAFIASGGAVTITDGTVNISDTDTAGWSLLSKIFTKVSSIVEAAISGNIYWKDEQGNDFAAKNYYSLTADENGELSSTPLTGTEDIEDGDVLLVYYAPEIVWVQSLTVTSENDTKYLKCGDELQLTASPDYGQEKYRPEDTDYGESVITWESSDTDIATVDENGKVTTVGTGTVTITATADVELRKSEAEKAGLDPDSVEDSYVIGTYVIHVVSGTNINSIKVTVEDAAPVMTYSSEDGTYSPVSVDLHAAAIPSSMSLTGANVQWSVTSAASEDGYKFSKDTGTYTTITFSEAETYTVTATYTVNGETICTASEDITVKKEVPLNSDVELDIVSNIQTKLTFADIKATAIQNLEVSSESGYNYAGNFSFYLSKKNDIRESASISKGTKTYTVLYEVSGDEEEAGYVDTTRTFTLVYGALSFSLGTDKGTTLVLLGTDEENTTAYPTASTVTPTWLFNGTGYTENEIEALLDVSVSLTPKSKKESVLKVESSTNESGEQTVTVSTSEKTGSSGITVAAEVSGTTLAGDQKTAALSSKTLSFTVKSNTPIVQNIAVSYKGSADEEATALADGGTIILQYADVKSLAQKYDLSLAVTDYNGTKYEEGSEDDVYPGAALKWTTSSSAIASVSGSGLSAKLTVKKGATGVAKITATAQDSGKKSFTFQVIVVDTDVRLDTSSVTVNSYSEETGKIYLYPNVLLSESNESVDVSVKVRALDSKTATSASERFTLTADESSADAEGYITISDENYDGSLNVQLTNSSASKSTFTMVLEVVTTVGGKNYKTFKTVKVKNSRSQASTSAKLTTAYNSYWSVNEENSYATILVTAKGEVKTEDGEPSITLTGAGADTFEIKSITESGTNSSQYILTVRAKSTATSIKTQKLAVKVTYDGYRDSWGEVSKTLTLTVKKTTPGFAVYGYNVYSPTFYTDLGENTIQVLLELPDNIAKDVTGNDNDFAVTLTAASAKYFTITDQTLVSGSEAVTLSKKGVETELSNALLITLRADKNKGASVQFAIQSSRFASGGTVNSKKLTVTAAKAASKLSLKFVDNNTGSAVTSYTLMKGKSEKEYISVTPTLSTTQGGRLEYYTKIEGTPGNLNIRTALDEDDNIYYTIMAENEDFFSSMKSVSLKFTTYVKSSTSNSGWVKLATKTLTLKKSKTADTTVTLKVKGSLNVVSPQSAVTITPTFKNMPQNATIYSVNFTNSADADQYDISADLSTGVVTLTKAENAGALPIAKDSIGLTYKIRLADGSIKAVSKAATVNVVQTATVKASTSSATLYNVSTGTNYGKTVALNVTKAEGASIETIEISGLDGSGISYRLNGDNTVTFYTDGTISRGVAKTYTAKMTVTLEGCGTKKSKPVTYTVSVKLALKK